MIVNNDSQNENEPLMSCLRPSLRASSTETRRISWLSLYMSVQASAAVWNEYQEALTPVVEAVH